MLKYCASNFSNNAQKVWNLVVGIPVTLKIWHDNSGEGKKAGWYCSKVVIVDLKLNKWYESA